MTERSRAIDGLESEIGMIIRRAKRLIRTMADSVHPDLGPANYLMLGYILDHGPLRASELVDLFATDKAAVSRQTQTMVELGLLERHTDPDDRRAHLLSASAEGTRLVTATRRRRRAHLDQSLVGWSDDELSTLVEGLRLYNRGMEEELSTDAD